MGWGKNEKKKNGTYGSWKEDDKKENPVHEIRRRRKWKEKKKGGKEADKIGREYGESLD